MMRDKFKKQKKLLVWFQFGFREFIPCVKGQVEKASLGGRNSMKMTFQPGYYTQWSLCACDRSKTSSEGSDGRSCFLHSWPHSLQIIARYAWSFQKTVLECEHKVPQRNCALSPNLLQGWRTDERGWGAADPHVIILYLGQSLAPRLSVSHLCLISHLCYYQGKPENVLTYRRRAFTNQKADEDGQMVPEAGTEVLLRGNQLWCSY